jgi:hypothetical protein
VQCDLSKDSLVCGQEGYGQGLQQEGCYRCSPASLLRASIIRPTALALIWLAPLLIARTGFGKHRSSSGSFAMFARDAPRFVAPGQALGRRGGILFAEGRK